jgi:GNAT superfamily N-acetyltransferase
MLGVVEISRRTEADLDELVAVARRVRDRDQYPIYEPAEGLGWFLSTPKPIAAWIARIDGAIVGHVALQPSATRGAMQVVAALGSDACPAYVSRLLVDTDRRGLRIGARLLDHARRWAVDAGRRPYLEALDVPPGAPALALYRAEGWIEIGRTRFDLLDDGTEEVVFAGPID